MRQNPRYRVSPTLLDSFFGYVNSFDIWEKFWGQSDNPSLSPEEFHQRQFNSLLRSLNREPIPFEDSLPADLGTVFNEIVDCLVLKKQSETIPIEKVFDTCGAVTHLKCHYNDRDFAFPIEGCLDFAEECDSAIPQYRVEGIISTKYGDVLLTGNIDELMPTAEVVDIKTTNVSRGSYQDGKFANNFQHHIYPFLLNKEGIECDRFTYLVYAFKFKYNTKDIISYRKYKELYNYDGSFSEPHIRYWTELLIEFVEKHKHLINNTRFFNQI